MGQQQAFAIGQSKKSLPGIPWWIRIASPFVFAITDFFQRQNGTVNRRVLGIFNLKTSANPNPVNGVKSFDVTVDPSRDLWFRHFVPTTDEAQNLSSLPIIILFHGGGFVYLSADNKSYDAVCRRFARKCPAVVVSVNYRLAPEHRYPAQYDDGFDVLKFLDNEKNRGLLPKNANLSCCFLVGDSAGGNIAHHVAKRASELTSTFDVLKVIGLVAIQPFFGGKERTEAELRLINDIMISVRRADWFWNAFLPPGEGMDRDHEVINVCGPRAVDISKLVNFPPTMVVVSGFDPLQDWQRRYYEWLKMSGKNVHLSEYPTMTHAFYIFPEVPESTQLILEIKNFIHKQCSNVVKN